MKLGAYSIEQDYSQYVSSVSKTILAVIGTAEKGPDNVATLCTSTQDLINRFGNISPKHLGLYAAQYFLSQSSKMYYVRALPTGAKKATGALDAIDSAGATVDGAIVIEALEYSNHHYILDITAGEDSYKWELYRSETAEKSSATKVETKEGLSFDDFKTLTSQYVKIKFANSDVVGLETSSTTMSPTVATGALDYDSAIKALEHEAIDFNLLVTPELDTTNDKEPSGTGVIAKILTLAEKEKGDFLYIIDPPKDLTIDEIIAWHNKKSTNTTTSTTSTTLNSSFGTLYYDWVNIYDPINKLSLEVPPSVIVPATYAASDRMSDVWFAPAGLTRGTIKGVLSPKTTISKKDADKLYSGIYTDTTDNTTTDNAINSIYTDPQAGLVLWGQKTLLRENTALNRVNVRRLMNYLRRVITAASNYLTFDPNDEFTWNNFYMKVNPVLAEVQRGRGLYSYRIIHGNAIVTDNDIDNYKMPCVIMIQPTKAAEEIPIYFALTRTGADFNEVLDTTGLIGV